MTCEAGPSSDPASASSSDDLPLPQAPYRPMVNWGGSPPRMASARASAYSGKPSCGCRLGTSATIGSGSDTGGEEAAGGADPHPSVGPARRQRSRVRCWSSTPGPLLAPLLLCARRECTRKGEGGDEPPTAAARVSRRRVVVHVPVSRSAWPAGRSDGQFSSPVRNRAASPRRKDT
jgi:hypothetical protein